MCESSAVKKQVDWYFLVGARLCSGSVVGGVEPECVFRILIYSLAKHTATRCSARTSTSGKPLSRHYLTAYLPATVSSHCCLHGSAMGS